MFFEPSGNPKMPTYRNMYVTLKDTIFYTGSLKDSELPVMGSMQAASILLSWNSRV